MTEYPILLKTPNNPIYRVALDCISLEDRTIITIKSPENVYIELHGDSRYLYSMLLKFARVANPDASYGQKVRELTPAQVIAYFQASPVLSYMADEVQKVLRPVVAGQADQLAGDVEKCRHLVNPSLADLAQALTGKRYYAGKTYDRVKAVQAALESSSSAQTGADLPAEEAA